MDIGVEKPAIVIEPIVEPVLVVNPRRRFLTSPRTRCP